MVHLRILIIFLTSLLITLSSRAAEAGPFAIPTFHCLGVYWSPPGGEADKAVQVRYNDIIGGGSNGSFKGAPGPDSDVYGNFVSHCWDDGLEIGQILAGVEEHGVRGEPTYAAGAGLDHATKTGRFELAAHSPGVAAGEWIPSFSDGARGSRPDIGAHPRGAPPMKFGVGAR